MPENGNITGYEEAAQRTIDLVDHADTPNELSDAVLETLIIMAYEAEVSKNERINIWHKATGLSKDSLAALYQLYETGAGYRRARLYGRYENERLEKERKNNGN